MTGSSPARDVGDKYGKKQTKTIGGTIMSKIQFYTADDIAEIMQISKPKAYEIIRSLNDELSRMGYLTVKGSCSGLMAQRMCCSGWGRC